MCLLGGGPLGRLRPSLLCYFSLRLSLLVILIVIVIAIVIVIILIVIAERRRPAHDYSALRVHGNRQTDLNFARSYVIHCSLKHSKSASRSAVNNGNTVPRRVCFFCLKPC